MSEFLSSLSGIYQQQAQPGPEAPPATPEGSNTNAQSGLYKTLSTASGALGALSALRAGQAQANDLELQAQFSELEADREKTATIERSNAIREALLKTTSAARVAFAANGIATTGQGTAATLQERFTERAGSIEGASRTQGEINSRTRRHQARNLMISADNARGFAGLQALNILANTASNAAMVG